MKPQIFCLFLSSSLAALGGDLQIRSFSGNGQLTWTNTFTNALYSVEWAPTVTGAWTDTWASLKGFAVGGPVSTAQVPMFYRVKYVTNLLLPLPIGSWTLMSVSNAVGDVWTQKTTVLGTVYVPSRGKDFTIVEMLIPADPSNAPLIGMRSTDSGVYDIELNCGSEELAFTNAPIGTSWTNMACGGRVTVATIQASESVTTAVGVFSCFKVRKQRVSDTNPNAYWVEWWSPGFGLVYWKNYWTGNPPEVYQLIGYDRNPK